MATRKQQIAEGKANIARNQAARGLGPSAIAANDPGLRLPQNFAAWLASLDQGQDQGPSAPSDSGGGGGGGVTFMDAPAAPAPQLASSPEWLAYLNALGLEQTQFSSDIEKQRGFARSAADAQTADIAAQGPGQRRQIAGSYEQRGMARSGAYLRALAEQRAAEQRQQAGVQSSLSGNLSNLESTLAQKMIDLQQRRSQQELSLRAQGYV